MNIWKQVEELDKKIDEKYKSIRTNKCTKNVYWI